jgi:hypothetical protein
MMRLHWRIPHRRSPVMIPASVQALCFCDLVNDTAEACLNKVLFAFIEPEQWGNAVDHWVQRGIQ